MKLVENRQVTQPNQGQVIKVKSVQIFRGVLTIQLKNSSFFPLNCKINSIVDVQLGPEYPHL